VAQPSKVSAGLSDWIRFVTPDWILGQVKTLEKSWIALKQSTTNPSVIQEADLFLEWAADVKKRNYFSLTMGAANISDDVIKWNKRYETAYYEAKKSPRAQFLAPVPSAVSPPQETSGIPWNGIIFLGVAIAALLIIREVKR
jgi:hypothetical protein